MGSGFFGVTDEYLGEADCRRERRPGSDRAPTLARSRRHPESDALGLDQNAAHNVMGQRIVRPLRKHLGYRRFGRREPRRPGRLTDRLRPLHNRPARHPSSASRLPGSTARARSKIAARLRHVFDVDPLVERRQSLKEEVHRIGIRYSFGPLRFGRRQFCPQLIGQASDDLVLHVEQIGQRLVEAFSPEMLAAFGVDELDIDTHAAGVALDRPFEHIADPKLLADFSGVDILALEREGGVAGDHEGAAKARQVGGQVLGDAVGEVILGGVV